MTANARIKEILGRHGEPTEGNVWAVQGTPVIKHACLERVAAKAGIRFDIPTVLRSERDEAVIMVAGRLGERLEWSIGEALIGINYRVTGKQAAYVWAMAEKRAKDRVILKLIELHGLAYSEEEADEFDRRNEDTPPVRPAAMSVDHMMHEITAVESRSALDALKADPSFRAGYKAADEVSRKRIEGALKAAEEDAAA